MIETSKIVDLVSLFSPDYIVLDCDGTLYPDIFAVKKDFDQLLSSYLQTKFNYSSDQCNEFIASNKIKFHTVSEIAACLQAGIDEQEFNEQVISKISLNTIGINTSFNWQSISEEIPIIIFTNNSSYFAHRIAIELGIDTRIIKIFGETELYYYRKPDKRCFETVDSFIGGNAKVLYFDDDISCLTTSKEFGWNTVLPVYKTLLDVKPTTSLDGILLKGAENMAD